MPGSGSSADTPDEALQTPAAARQESAPSSGNRLAAGLRGFGPLGILAILVILAGASLTPALAGVLILVWVRLSRTPWREIGYLRPRSWIGDGAVGIVLGVTFKLLMKAVVMPLLGADPINRAYHYLAANPAGVLAFLPTVIVGAGFGEETFFRGYLFERLGKLLGRSPGAKTVIVLATSALFGVVHYPGQGLAGAEQATITGLVFGSIFAVTGRIWLLMCAHVAFDLAAVAIIYLDLETKIAHLVFR